MGTGFYTHVGRRGNKILYRGYTANGTAVMERVDFRPELFVETDKETDVRSIYGGYLKRVDFDTMKEAREFIDTYSEVSNFRVHGNTNLVTQFINDKFAGEIDYRVSDINVGTLDIEVESKSGFPYPEQAAHEVTLIQYKSSKSSIFHIFGVKHYDTTIAQLPPGTQVRYVKCADEADLFEKFLIFWENHYPDVVTGWNVRLFDVTYIVNRLKKVLGEDAVKRLSPWGQVNYRQIAVKGKTLDAYEFEGIVIIDYLDVFQKFGFSYGNQESYKLDHIAHVVLGERKVSYEEYGSLQRMYEEDFQKFVDYGIKDVSLIEALEKKTKLLEVVFAMSYKAGVNYSDTLGTTAIWEAMVARYLKGQGMAPPPGHKQKAREYPGGFVKTPVNGKYKWIVNFDLNSLYPMTMVQYNMSPETVVGTLDVSGVDHYLKHRPEHPEHATAANGTCFRKDKQGFLPKIIEGLYEERVVSKKQMIELKKTGGDKAQIDRLNNVQMSVKIFLNSLYGACASQYFRYFDIRIAEGVTLSGQLALRWAERAVNVHMNRLMKTAGVDYVIYADTDSIYVNFEKLVEKVQPDQPVDFLDKAVKQVFDKVIDDAYAELFDHMHAYKNSMGMKRENIASSGIWDGKKRYILNVHDSEGVRYAEPVLKVTGIEAVKSSTPQVVRKKFEKAYAIMLDGREEDLHRFVRDFEAEFKTLPPEDVSFPRGVSDIEKWRGVDKGVPIHVRAALVFNEQLNKHGLVLEEIKNGTKVKFAYLKVPNPTRNNVVAFEQYLPREFDLHQYVDYGLQFEKTFKDPLKNVAAAIGWNLEKKATLDDFFS